MPGPWKCPGLKPRGPDPELSHSVYILSSLSSPGVPCCRTVHMARSREAGSFSSHPMSIHLGGAGVSTHGTAAAAQPGASTSPPCRRGLETGAFTGYIPPKDRWTTVADKLIPIHNDDPYLLLEHGQRALRDGHFQQTAAFLDRALRLSPHDLTILNARASLFLAQHRPRNALLLLDRACALEPSFAEVWNNRGVALARIGRLKEAETSFDRAISLMGDDPAALTNRALTILQMGDLEGAVDDLTSVVEQQPGNPEPWLYKAMVHMRTLELRQSRHAFLQAARRTWASGGSRRNALFLVLAASVLRLLLSLGIGEARPPETSGSP